MDDGDPPKQPDHSHYYDQPTRWQRFVAEMERQADERRTKKNNESATDKAARRTATATVFIAIFTAVTIAVGVSQFLAMRGQLNVMQGQLNVMEAQSRPWLTIDHIEPEPAFMGIDFGKDGSVGVSPIISVKNVGQAVAIGAFLETKLVLINDDLSEGYNLMLAQNDFCDTIRAETFRNPQMLGDAIFPDKTKTLGERPWIDAKSTKKNVVQFQGKKYVRLILIGCIDYQFYVSPKRHQTRFIYSVQLKDGIGDLVPIGANIPSSQIVFAPYLFGNGYAD